LWRCGKVSSALARPHDLTCQVCEKLCENEERFFRHIQKYHPDYWRVFASGHPLTDFVQPASTSPAGGSPSRRFAARRDRRFTCGACGKNFAQVSRRSCVAGSRVKSNLIKSTYFIVRLKVDQRAGQLSLPHVGITKTEKNKTKT